MYNLLTENDQKVKLIFGFKNKENGGFLSVSCSEEKENFRKG